MDEKLESRIGRFKESWAYNVRQRGTELHSYARDGGIADSLARSLGMYTRATVETELYWRFRDDFGESISGRVDAKTLENALRNYTAHVKERLNTAGNYLVRAEESGQRMRAYEEMRACEEVMEDLQHNFPEYVAKGWR